MQEEPDTQPAADCSSEPCQVQVSSEPPAWTEYLQGRSDATIYHDPRWGQLMQAAYGNRPLYLTARRSERIAGVLQLITQKSLLFGSHLCSLPYFDASGILADDVTTADSLIAEAANVRHTGRAAWVELRQAEPLPGALPVTTDKVTLQLSLPGSDEALWDSLKAKVRNQVRKASRAELSCVSGGRELLREFHRMYARNMRDLGSPPHAEHFFHQIAEAFGTDVRLFVVRQGDRPVAASLTLLDHHAVRVPWAASDWRVRQLNANMLLYWEMLADSCRRQAGRFDFGRSTRDAGTHRFKKQWGPEEIPLYWHYVLPEGGSPPKLRPDSRKYRLMVACWKRLPVCVARLLGPRIIRKLS